MKWISVKDKLPDLYIDCIVINNRKIPHMSFLYQQYGKYVWSGPNDEGGYPTVLENITHWLPIPDYPKDFS